MGYQWTTNDEDVEVSRSSVIRAGGDNFYGWCHHGWFEVRRDIMECNVHAQGTNSRGRKFTARLDVFVGKSAEKVNAGDVGKLD